AGGLVARPRLARGRRARSRGRRAPQCARAGAVRRPRRLGVVSRPLRRVGDRRSRRARADGRAEAPSRPRGPLQSRAAEGGRVSTAPQPPPAFDLRNRPDGALLDQCVPCGFCLPTCPTYDLSRVEMESPRGRLVLIAEGLEPGGTITDDQVEHLDSCLGCMACVTACPSGVRYDELIED